MVFGCCRSLLDAHSIKDFRRHVEEMSHSTQIHISRQFPSENVENISAIFNCSGMSIDYTNYDIPIFVFGGQGCTASVSVIKKQCVENVSSETRNLANIHPPVCAIAAALACQELLQILGGSEKKFPLCIKIDGDLMRAIYE